MTKIFFCRKCKKYTLDKKCDKGHKVEKAGYKFISKFLK